MSTLLIVFLMVRRPPRFPLTCPPMPLTTLVRSVESAAKQYVLDLLEIDPITQEMRRRTVMPMTDANYWKKFVREHKSEIEDGIKSGLVRSITVESANRLEVSGRVYKYAVDFVQTDNRNEIGRAHV